MGGMGIESLSPMQPAMQPAMQSAMYNPLQNNYYSGMPMMANGGRIGYEEGGMGMMQDQNMMQPQQPQQMMEPPLQGMEQPQADIKDPKQALEIIIQMLIAQGIPPEQAKEIAIQMVQAVAEGGMQEMSDERVEARFGGRIGYASGGIGSLVNREGYFLGSVFKGIGKAVKGVTKAVKSIVKSDLGKAALAAAAIYATGGGALFGGPGFASTGTLFGPGGATSNFLFGTPGFGAEAATSGIFGLGGNYAPLSGSLLGPATQAFNQSSIGSFLGGIGTGGGGSTLGSLGTSFLGGVLGGALGGMPQQQPGESDADYQNRVNEYKLQFQTAINNPNPQFGGGLYPNNPFYPQREAKALAANGGRIGYQEGGIGNLIKQVTQQEYFGTPMMANGGRMGYELGSEVPVRKNEAGVKELDYRDTGGFVPPIGIKERADDIPAMLSNNEFVFTADAVRNAGGGDENIGAQRMYKLMKNLEAGGSV
jgi:hypothetical protein